MRIHPTVQALLGGFPPRAGGFTLRVGVTGANPAATGANLVFGPDCLALEKP